MQGVEAADASDERVGGWIIAGGANASIQITDTVGIVDRWMHIYATCLSLLTIADGVHAPGHLRRN